MTCDHGLRWGHWVFACELELGHDGQHGGRHPEFGDMTVNWLDGDRRDFTGGDPGQCDRVANTVEALNWSNVDGGPGSRCILPAGHHGRHAS